MDKTMDGSYERLCEMMGDGRNIRNVKVDFRSLCGRIGADHKALCDLFYMRLGMSGDEVLEAFRTGRKKK
jgi:hypothetical protein